MHAFAYANARIARIEWCGIGWCGCVLTAYTGEASHRYDMMNEFYRFMRAYTCDVDVI